MIVHGIRFVWFVRVQISPALNLPKWIVFSIIPLSGIILSLHAFSNLLHSLKDAGRDH
jgi:TRAP-type C4-dicarboxylate transport system permease small subunit